MIRKLAQDMHTLIIQANAKENMEAIPHSDQFMREVTSLFSIEPHLAKQVITMLRESHKIFSIEVVQEDKNKEIKKIEGYVDTDLKTVKRLKNLFQNALMDEYEHQHGRRLMTHQIIKEIYNRIAMFKNTPLGQLANKAIMLEEYENLIEKNYVEYSDSWKVKKMNELLEQTEALLAEEESKKNTSNEANALKNDDKEAKNRDRLRAVDTVPNDDLSQALSPHSINKMIQIYGVNFFFRVQMRKYHFRQLREIIETGSFFKRDDLKLLKDMIKTIRASYARDPELANHTEEINKLDQSVSHQILYVRR